MDPQDISLGKGGPSKVLLQLLQAQWTNQYSHSMEIFSIDSNNVGSNNNGSKPAQDKGKKMIVENLEVEQSYKFKEDSLIEKVALAVEAKRQQHIKRVQWRKGEKKSWRK